MASNEFWPEELGILFALKSFDGEIAGKVKFNKVLALLQRDGFPIRNKFHNAIMGPMDKKLDTKADELSREGFLKIRYASTNKSEKMTIYWLSPKGLTFLEENYAQHIRDLLSGPYADIQLKNFRRTQNDVTKMVTHDFVEKVHDELNYYESGKFRAMIQETLKKAMGEFQIAELRYDESCAHCCEVMGSLDFSIMSLTELLEKHWASYYSGKYFVRYNAERIVNFASEMCNHIHSNEIRLFNDIPSKHRKQILYRLMCLENNCSNYGICPTFDLENDCGVPENLVLN